MLGTRGQALPDSQAKPDLQRVLPNFGVINCENAIICESVVLRCGIIFLRITLNYLPNGQYIPLTYVGLNINGCSVFTKSLYIYRNALHKFYA